MLRRLFTSTRTPKVTFPEKPKGVAHARQATGATHRARIAALESDNANLIRIVQRLKSENKKLMAELELSRPKHKKGRRQPSNRSHAHGRNNGGVQPARRKAV